MALPEGIAPSHEPSVGPMLLLHHGSNLIWRLSRVTLPKGHRFAGEPPSFGTLSQNGATNGIRAHLFRIPIGYIAVYALAACLK